MHSYKDQLGRTVLLADKPQRIVSLVPSQTELLFDLGLDKEVIAITKFCVHPEHWFRNKNRIGGTKNIHIDQINALQPDLIIANKEENMEDQVAALSAIAPVWTSDIHHTTDALEMIRLIGEITFTGAKAEEIIQQLKNDLAEIVSLDRRRLRVAYLIWKDPYMTVGADTFIHDIMSKMGWRNVFADRQRYPEITVAEMAAHKPDLVLLSSEPYPFRQQHLEELGKQMPGTRLLLADGEIFSWYGSRMLHILPYFREVILPQIAQMNTDN